MRRPSRALTGVFLALAVAVSGPLAGAVAAPALAQGSAAPAAERTAAPDAAESMAPRLGAVASLPRNLSPWGMFLSADLVVKVVMVGLALASVLTGTAALAKTLELLAAGRAGRRLLARIEAAPSLRAAAEAARDSRAPAARFVAAAVAEAEMSSGLDGAGLKERVASRLERIEATAARRVARGTGLLATIGATAPFVGLFGTVWGIMNSFVGISKAQTTNLAVVAPGIAEALLATALGLVAAIPAVIVYNLLARWIAGYRILLGDAAASVLRLVGRDLDRAARPHALRAAE